METASDSSSGLRSQLFHLLPLPRHTLFHVRLTIHQLSSLPLVSGKFAVRWKFKHMNADAAPKRGPSFKTRNGTKKDASPAKGGPYAFFKGKGVEDSSDHIATAERQAQSDATPATASPATTTTSLPSTAAHPSPPVDFQTEPKGLTTYAPLHDYNVVWEHTVDAAVEFTVQRETADLLPNELKLVVLQHVMPGDPDAPANPRIGALYLDLAEYADMGDVTRKYLLRESKTNATLQLTLNVQYISGEKTYKPPPLRKGEVMAGISGLLATILGEVDSIEIKPPGAPPPFCIGEGIIPYSEDWSYNPIRRPTPRYRMNANGAARGLSPALSDIYGWDTRGIIEAIFNPSPIDRGPPKPSTSSAAINNVEAPVMPTAPPGHMSTPVGHQLTSRGRISDAATQPRDLSRSATPVQPATPASRPGRPGTTPSNRKSLDESARSVSFSLENIAPDTLRAGDETIRPNGWLKRIFSNQNDRAMSTSSASSASSDETITPGRRGMSTALDEARFPELERRKRFTHAALPDAPELPRAKRFTGDETAPLKPRVRVDSTR